MTRAQKFCLGSAVLLLAGFCTVMVPQWLTNPDLSHGLFMPAIFAFLVYEARSQRAGRFAPRAGIWRLLSNGLFAAGLAGVAASGLFAAALEWSHPLAGFVGGIAIACLLLGLLLVLSQPGVRAIPLGWSSFLAATLWILCAPIPPGTYSRLTLALQGWVSRNVVGTLHLLGIPAERHGNIIELARATVGIEEACSGVRSLVSCVFAGLFFSGALVRRTSSRVLLIGLSAPLAIAMNFIRSLALTLMANAGMDISGTWHDVTGFAVLGVTAAILGALAIFLARFDRTGPDAARADRESSAADAPRGLRTAAFALGTAVVLAGFFAFNTSRLAPAPDKPVPDLAAVVPDVAPGWGVLASNDLNRFSATLQTDTFIQRTYFRGAPPSGVQITVYIAYWKPGQANASLVATHTPEACWPGTGWTLQPAEPSQLVLRSGDRTLPVAEYRLFESGTTPRIPQHVWYWHLYGGEPIQYVDPLSPRNLLEIALKFGFRRAGEQMFVRISSNRPWSEIGHEPLVAGILSRLGQHGL